MAYDALGRLATEESTQQLASRGMLPTAGTLYRIQDALGSTRLLAGAAGEVRRHDYLPFSEELTFTAGSVRANVPGYRIQPIS